ncbi:hypothetical protein SLEP1_g44970 [Rubroshorea leprosula]|uniref:DCD domain-containing protein n=1 Tax=Rubroshorea leprosula TaxID=152421 RepID=A0AAV5LHV8_9ROSI|nr:hypothetical protein SLEP1_g44970 [Rubroshorea leprosula]
MSSRVKMKDEKQRRTPGAFPEFGAIFMSNSATKRECFKRKLFGLPSSYAHFVNHVKAGMILFLFEFERRELHGVFEASCDGEMNIVPNAFNSLGKQFPAQVKFTHLWSCTPLSEEEFRDAIRENYFSAKKFSFGLSEDQVLRLLSLFSLRKIKEQAPERHLTSSGLAGPSDSSTSKVKRVVHSNRVMSNKVTSEQKADGKLKFFPSTVHPGDPFCNDGREINDERFQIPQNIGGENKMDGEMAPGISVEYFGDSFTKIRGDINGNRLAKSDRARNEKNVNVGYSIGDYGSFSDVRFTRGSGYENEPVVSMGYSLGNSREASDGVRFTRSGRFKNENFGNNVFVPATSMECPSFFPTNHNAYSYSSNHVSNADTCVQDPTRPNSTSICTMEPKRSNISYPTTYGDAIITRTHPHVPSINCRCCSSTLGMGQDSSSLHSLQSAPDNTIAGNILPSRNQPLSSYLKSGSTSMCPDVDSHSRNHILLAHLNQYEHYSKASLSHPPSGENLTVKSSENEGDDGISFLMHSQSGNNGRISEPLSSSSFGLSYQYHPISSEVKAGNKVPEFENAIEFATDVLAFDEHQFLLGGQCPAQPKSTYHHQKTSLNPPVYQSSESMDVDCQKKRGSVFSRLALAPKACRRENNLSSGNNVHGIDGSVDEVMSTLYHCHYPWSKVSRGLLIKHDYGANIGNKKQVEMNSKSLKDPSAIPKEMSIRSIPPVEEMSIKSIAPVEENDSQQAGGTPFVDFKRRSVLRKPHPDSRTENCSGSAEKDTSTGQRKRRKLIRPDFGKNHPSEEKARDADVPENLQRPSLESSAGPEKVSVSHINKNTIPEYVKLLLGISQADHEGKHTVNIGRNSSHEDINVEGEAPASLQRPSLESSVGTEKVSVSHVNESKIYEYVKLLRGMSQTHHEGKHTVDIGSSSSENISVNGDAPEILQRCSPQSSIDKRHTNFNASVSHVSKIRQSDELLDLLHQTSHEGKSISMGRRSNMEEFKIKSSGRNADEHSKKLFEKDHSQDVSCWKLYTKADESFSAKDPRQDESCQGGDSASPIVVRD